MPSHRRRRHCQSRHQEYGDRVPHLQASLRVGGQAFGRSADRRSDDRADRRLPDARGQLCDPRPLGGRQLRKAKSSRSRSSGSFPTLPSKLVRIGVWEGARFCGAILYGVGANRHIASPHELRRLFRIGADFLRGVRAVRDRLRVGAVP
jgi:hypothetical protein